MSDQLTLAMTDSPPGVISANTSGPEPSEVRGGMFLGWYDPDPKKPVRAKLAEAVARYEEKFGATPHFCLTSPTEAAALAEPTRKHPGELPVQVDARSYIARHTFYIGEESS